MYGFYRLGTARSSVRVANVQENINNLKILMDEAKVREVSLTLFPATISKHKQSFQY